MIGLLRDLAHLTLAWCIGTTLTYGIVESSLLMPLRIAIASVGPSGWWAETLVYCPFCVGFWCQGVSWGVSLQSGWAVVWGMSVGTAALLVFRAFDLELFRDRKEPEQGAIDDVRALEKAKETTR